MTARPNQPRNRVGQFTHLGIRGHLKGHTTVKRYTAEKDAVVRDPNLGIDRKVIAGQQIPPDLVDAYNEKTGSTFGHEDESTEPETPAATDEAARRGRGRRAAA